MNYGLYIYVLKNFLNTNLLCRRPVINLRIKFERLKIEHAYIVMKGSDLFSNIYTRKGQANDIRFYQKYHSAS